MGFEVCQKQPVAPCHWAISRMALEVGFSGAVAGVLSWSLVQSLVAMIKLCSAFAHLVGWDYLVKKVSLV